MEAVNEGCKLVAQAKELIKKYLEANDIENDSYLIDGAILLDMALEKFLIK